MRTGRGIAGEGNAGRRCIAEIAEHHRLHRDRSAPVFRDIVKPAIGLGTCRHPGLEDGANGAPELLLHIQRKGLAGRLLDASLVSGDDLQPVLGGESGIEAEGFLILVFSQNVLELVMLDAEHDIGIHVDEAAIAVIGETAVLGALGQSFDGRIIEAEIEDGIHHAGHRGSGTGAHRNEQWILGVTEARADDAADFRQCRIDIGAEALRIGTAILVIAGADVGGDGEAGRNRQA